MVYLGSEGLHVTHTSVTALKEKLKKCWAEVDSQTVRATCDHVTLRLRQVIKEKGEYIEYKNIFLI